MDKLNEREKKYKELMKTNKSNPEDGPFTFFKLSYPANKKYPGLAIEDPMFTCAFAGARLYQMRE